VEKTITACFKVPESQHRKLKSWAGGEGILMQDVFTQMLMEFLISRGIAKPDGYKTKGEK
jgi:hypothetical protein